MIKGKLAQRSRLERNFYQQDIKNTTLNIKVPNASHKCDKK